MHIVHMSYILAYPTHFSYYCIPYFKMTRFVICRPQCCHTVHLINFQAAAWCTLTNEELKEILSWESEQLYWVFISMWRGICCNTQNMQNMDSAPLFCILICISWIFICIFHYIFWYILHILYIAICRICRIWTVNYYFAY